MRGLPSALLRILIWVIVALMLCPVGWILITSIKPGDISQSLPPVWSFTPTLRNYADVLSGSSYTSQVFASLLLHSAAVTAVSTVLALLAGIPAAYSLARLRFWGRKFTAMWILSTIMFPPAVSVIPVFIVASRLGMMDTLPVLVVPYAAFGLPMVIWMLRSYVQQIPFEIEEAAMVDGASQFDILVRIVLPLLMPGVVAAALLMAMMAWNEFLFALTLTRSVVKTAPVGISEFTSMYGTQWGDMTAAATITVAPILVLTLILRRRLVAGLTFGAVK